MKPSSIVKPTTGILLILAMFISYGAEWIKCLRQRFSVRRQRFVRFIEISGIPVRIKNSIPVKQLEKKAWLSLNMHFFMIFIR